MKKTIVFDFDGVIHKGYSGWKDGSIYGEIDYKLLDFIIELMEKYYVVISSCRPAKQIVNFMNDLKYKDLVFEQYDSLYWQKDNIVGVTNKKAVGILYIDDKAFWYQNDFNTDCNINMIRANLKESETMEDIKVGEYVRTKEHGIFKVLKFVKTSYGYYWGINDKRKAFSIGKGGNLEVEIAKHSPNIIDLIEIGDYVNGKEIEEIYGYDEDGNDTYELGVGEIDCEDGYYIPLKDIEIESIVTHESFNSIKYEVI